MILTENAIAALNALIIAGCISGVIVLAGLVVRFSWWVVWGKE